MKKKYFLYSLLFVVSLNVYGQEHTPFYERMEINIDTLDYYSHTHYILSDNKKKYYFDFGDDDNPVVLFKIWPATTFKKITLKPSTDFEIIDSMRWLEDHYRFKLRFNHLTETEFLSLHFNLTDDLSSKNELIELYPVTTSVARIYPGDNVLYIGEEKTFEIITNNPGNLVYSSEWSEGQKIDYRVAEQSGKIFLHIVPNETGKIHLHIPVRTRKPALINGKLNHTYINIDHTFNVRSGRINFLGIDRKEITLDENSRTGGIEIQLENSWHLALNKTYRIENQEAKGGALIAELFTKQRLSNNKILCILRPYNYHRTAQGYLYIKDGDVVKSITNVNITPKTTIHGIYILRSGSNWIESNTVYPGESIEIRIDGEGLHKASFFFEGLENLTTDTVLVSENQAHYKFHVPEDIAYKKINIYNHSQLTGSFLKVAENKNPRKFDYIFLNYGDLGRNLISVKSPVLYERTVKDVILTYNHKKIDSDMLYGPQYIDIEIRITGRRNELIELRTIEDIVVCPDESSPRHAHYPISKCTTEDFSLNKYIRKKTYDLDEWSRIQLRISNQKEVYGNKGYEKEVEIILKKKFTFDVDVSFPAGLITISKQDVTDDQGNVIDTKVDFGSLSYISMAMIAQFSFYHPEKIATYRPYKVGAGFLAFNAFNFSEDNRNRDIGVVVLGSLYPTTRDTKLSFPLYIGGGYFLKEAKWFITFGPGIRVKL